MASLTLDQKAVISDHQDFKNRVDQVLKDKAFYFTNLDTPNRADVNVRTQKQKRYGRQILVTPNFSENSVAVVGDFWLTIYDTANPDLDVNGIPTASAIDSDFDPTYNYFAGVVDGDENQTEIEW